MTLYSDGTRVTEPCTNTLDTCVDDNAGCNGTVCDCNAYFTWNGTICGRFSLKTFSSRASPHIALTSLIAKCLGSRLFLMFSPPSCT